MGTYFQVRVRGDMAGRIGDGSFVSQQPTETQRSLNARVLLSFSYLPFVDAACVRVDRADVQ